MAWIFYQNCPENILITSFLNNKNCKLSMSSQKGLLIYYASNRWTKVSVLYYITVSLRYNWMIVSAFLFKGLTSDQISLLFPPLIWIPLNWKMDLPPVYWGSETGSKKCFWKGILINNIKECSVLRKITRLREFRSAAGMERRASRSSSYINKICSVRSRLFELYWVMIRIMITWKCDQFTRLWRRNKQTAIKFKEAVESFIKREGSKSKVS